MWPWPLTTRSYQLSETFVLICTSDAIIVLNRNTSHEYTKEEFVLWAMWQFFRIFDFDPCFQGRIHILDFYCNLHIKGNHFCEYVHTRSKNERGIHVLSHGQVLSISDLDLWPQGHISYLKPLFNSTHHDQSLFISEAIVYQKSLMHVYPR